MIRRKFPVCHSGIVMLAGLGLVAASRPEQVKRSEICIYTLQTKSVEVVYSATKLIEAPNWSPDGKVLLINSGGELWKLSLGPGEPRELQKVDVGAIRDCNNDKGFSPDGKLIAFSASGNASDSQVYTVPSQGGAPKRIVSETPSYFHAFSPDGRWLAVVAKRAGNFDLFRVPVSGGKQERLTSSPAYDDGPDYSPDGKWIYFNSNRSGSWDIWRMPADGAGPDDERAEQVTSDQLEDWFPHCSPDGKWLVFLTFPKGTSGHDERIEVELRMVPLPGATIEHSPIQVLTKFTGGQGTINVNSWAPDSTKLAFIRYEK